jgi:hypothetical protein
MFLRNIKIFTLAAGVLEFFLLSSGLAQEPEKIEPISEQVPELVLPMASLNPQMDDFETLTSGLNLGSFLVHSFFYSRNYYNDNIFRASDHEISDFIWNLNPGITISNFYPDLEQEPDNQIFLKYAPTLVKFTDGKAADSVEQDAFFQYRHVFGLTHLDVNQRFQHLTGNNDEIGTRIRRNIFHTAALLDYSISEKTMLDAALTQHIENYPTAISTAEWKGSAFFLHEATAKLKIGPGLALGYLNVQGAPNHYFEQLLSKIIYDASEILRFSVDGGADLREYTSGVQGIRVSGVFHGGFEYRPTDSFTFLGNLFREIQSSSIFRNQNYIKTGASLEAKQRLIHEWMLGVLLGYEHDEYDALSQLDQHERIDDYGLIRGSLAIPITTWWQVELYTLYRNRGSTVDAFDYQNREIGFEFKMEF